MASKVDVLARCTTSRGKSSYLRPTIYSESFSETFPVSAGIFSPLRVTGLPGKSYQRADPDYTLYSFPARDNTQFIMLLSRINFDSSCF
jgi:hypothetical protein